MTTTSTDRRPGGALRHAFTGPVGRLILSVAVVVAVFAGVLPQIADYGEAWQLVRNLTTAEAVVVGAVAALNLVSYVPLWLAAAPGLTWWRALMTDQASTAIANTVPVGFAFGVGTTAAMFHSYGLSPAEITRAVAVTGIWNNLVKLAMPVLALTGLILVQDAPAGLAVAAVLGIVVLLVVVVVLVVALTHRGAGAGMAATAERLAMRLDGRRGHLGWVERTERFRIESLELLRHRWVRLTVAAVASHAALFLVLLTCLRVVDGPGPQVHWVVVLAVFAVTRLVTLVPITPGALGVAELSYVAGLTAVGFGAAGAAAAVFLFRVLTWFVPIPLGLAAWLAWRRGVGRVAAPTEPETAEGGTGRWRG